MDLLKALCARPEAEIRTFDLAKLRQLGVNLSAAFEPRGQAWIIIGIVAGLGLAWVLIHRLVKGEDAGAVAGNTIEGLLYGAIGAYSGGVAGILLAVIVPPPVVGAGFFVFAAIAVLMAIIAAVRGTGDAGWKVLGFFEFIAIAAGLVVAGVYAFQIPAKGRAWSQYLTYVEATSVALAISGGLTAIISAILRGSTAWVGWLLAHANGGWGAIGNLLGLMTHVASWNFYAGHGKVDTGALRRFYVCYEKGLSLKTNASGHAFAFSEGAVMSADSADLRKHESVHVLQHLITGPFYPLTHFAWFIVWIPVALIMSPIKGIGVGEAITAMSYYNNPWEVIAYSFAGDRHTSDPLVFEDVAGWILCIIWLLLGLACFILLGAWRFGAL